MKKLLPFVLSVALAGFFTGCGDDEKNDPSPETGTVTGSISPANGASQVYLIAGIDTVKGTPNSSGFYEIDAIKIGTYSVTVKPNLGYEAPTPTSVIVTDGNTKNIPVITLATKSLMVLSMDGINYSATPTFSVAANPNLYIRSNGYEFGISLPKINGPGTFTTRGASSSWGFTVYKFSNSESYSTYRANSTGTLNVTSYDPVTKKGNATFSYTAINFDLTTTKIVSNGLLLNVSLSQ